MKKIKGGLIVSCQALEDEPLHSSYIMTRMAVAAKLGGACGIRANGVADITAIRQVVKLPMIGIIKEKNPNSQVIITPSEEHVDQLVRCGVEIIAVDATNRLRPGNITLAGFFGQIRKKYPDQLFMADCSNLEEGIFAAELGFDIVATTLMGISKGGQTHERHVELVKQLVKNQPKPVIAEGNIWDPEQLKEVLDAGAFAAVIGSAITRPQEITKRFIKAIK
ncbi:MAG TPA: N-acetylmannosamine-6-phosphate 2-epimerase [Clostridiaceae bacterium]|nr:N-acetylmannosamine-6-phosphate 2-epimerase [Clostridiaceae bacterium]